METNNSLKIDLEHIVQLTLPLVWDRLRKKKILITGGTGFFGVWLLEAILYANEKLSLDVHVTVLTRSPQNFERKAPHLFHSGIIYFVEGDVKNFPLNVVDKCDLVIHAATEASEELNNNRPFEMMDSIVEGTKRVLEFARVASVKRLLFISSGAVYGAQPMSVMRIPEDCMNGPDVLNTRNVYAESKRLSELMCSLYADQFGIEIPIARCFAFVGPYLNLNIHFAIGNFIRNGLAGDVIEIKGDGTPMRSYLYSADLVIWLLTLLVKGESKRAYNVGSDDAINIEGLAKIVCECFDNKVGYKILLKHDPTKAIERYVPSIERTRKEMELQVHIGLKESIRKTINWNLRKHESRN